MAKKDQLPVESQCYNYALLDSAVAERVRGVTVGIRERVKKTLEDLIAIGQSLLAVKEVLPHGQFGPWLRTELGWKERTARNFMSVATQFGSISAMIADLKIQPTAAYLLSAPSAPEEARRMAIERAEAGEKITTRIATDLLTRARKRLRRQMKPLSAQRLLPRIRNMLERYRQRWEPGDLAELAQYLRGFVDQLESERQKKK